MDSILEMMSLVVTLPSGSGPARTKIAEAPFKPYADLCVPVVKSYRQQMEDRKLTLQFRNEYDMGPIYADINDFMHIMQNIVGNAIKYTYLGKPIYINLEAARLHSRFAAIHVVSESLVIRADEREQIFRFRYRAESARDSGAEGEGRGLAIARGKARQFNGDVVHSYLLNMNVFTLLIPRHFFRPPA